MAYTEKHPTYTLDSFHKFRDDIQSVGDGDAVIEQVRRDPNGLGLFWYRGQDLKGVKLLEISPGEGAPAVALIPEPKIQDDYPLAEPLMLYVHPKAPQSLGEFGRFCTGPVAAEIVARHAFMTPHHVREHAVNKRVKAFVAGEGDRIMAVGPASIREILPDLATEYARAKEPAQVSFKATTTDKAAIGAFVGERGSEPELLFLTSRPSDTTLAADADAWRKLAPAEHVLAGRATAVIVSAANKLDMLPQAQIEAIFAGEMNDWEAIGGTGLPAPVQRRGPNVIPINRFGARGHDAATVLAHREQKPARTGRLTLLPDTKAVAAAVSLDPQAIGLVNFAELPRTGQTVKVLGVQVAAHEPGQPAPVIRPTTETIRSEAYPYAERLRVYVDPQASDAAKGFVELIATCGVASASAETDSVRAVMQAYQKHGWLPLADAAIQLEAEAVISEAEARAAPPQPGKSKRK